VVSLAVPSHHVIDDTAARRTPRPHEMEHAHVACAADDIEDGGHWSMRPTALRLRTSAIAVEKADRRRSYRRSMHHVSTRIRAAVSSQIKKQNADARPGGLKGIEEESEQNKHGGIDRGKAFVRTCCAWLRETW
jgi:hypothetical protein